MDGWEIYLTDEARDWIDALNDRSQLLEIYLKERAGDEERGG